jgi:hypothetical protein
MAAVYFARSGAAKAALARDITAFETYQPVPKADPNAWCYAEREPGPGTDYALLYAADKDWVHHCEVTEKKVPVLVVTVTKAELPNDIPKLFVVQPITPSLWTDPDAKSTRKHIATGAAVERRHAEPGTNGQQVPKPPRKAGAVSMVWDICANMAGAPRKEVIAACVAQGINPSTASVQYSAWAKNRAAGG